MSELPDCYHTTDDDDFVYGSGHTERSRLQANFSAGAAVAFGLVGMAEAIRSRTACQCDHKFSQCEACGCGLCDPDLWRD